MGFEVIDMISKALDVTVRRRKFGARLGETVYAGVTLLLLKPWQYMNCSGQVVATALGFYQLPIQQLMVVYDDMALEPGRLRIRAQGSAGGHNGLADIIERLKTEQFARCRVGIGDCGAMPSADYVLTRPLAQERPLLTDAVIQAREAVLFWVEQGIDQTMNVFNPR
jgi:PTH1 family peptidyl-tRNA hydrolase